MKFTNLYNNLAKKYLLEQDENQQNLPNQPVDQEQASAEMPEQTIDSKLPDEETIDLNEEKYKSLLLMVQKALIQASKDNVDVRNRLADIEKVIETTPLKAENMLRSELELGVGQFPKGT